MTKDSSKGGAWPVSGLKQPFAPASSGKIAPVIFDYDPWTEDYGEPNDMLFDGEKSERSATEEFHHENGLREIGVDSGGRARFALGNCVHLETEVRRSVAGLGNRVSWLLREAAAAKTYGLNYAYGGVNIFPGTDLESAACVARPSQDFDTTIQHFDLPDRPSEATGLKRFKSIALLKAAGNGDCICCRLGNAFVRTPKTVALPGFRPDMPQSEFIQLIGEQNAIDADIVEKTASAVQGILGLNHNSERVEECDQITVPKQGAFKLTMVRPEDWVTAGLTAEQTATGLGRLREQYVHDRMEFLSSSAWMQLNLMNFDTSKFNVVVHVREGDQSQDSDATNKQLSMIVNAAESGLLGELAGRKVVVHVFGQHTFSADPPPRGGDRLLVCVPHVTEWWVRYKQSNHDVVGAELNTHCGTNIVQALDAMITADVLGLGYSTFSGSAAMLAQGRAVYMKDGWPRGQHGDAVQVPHPWYADWLTCAEEIQTTVRARPVGV